MKIVHILSLFLIMLVIACSPKTTEQVVETPTPTPPPAKQAPDNPCTTFDELGANRDEVETAYVLYRDYVKAKKYEEALSYWETAYYGAPASNGRVKYQFDDGIKIYTHFYRSSDDATQKKAYIDTIMSIYDKRMECFGDAAYIQGRKGFDYYYSFPGTVSDAEILELFKKNIDAKGKKADYFIINPMTKIIVDGLVDKSVDFATGQKYAKKLQEAIDYGMANCKGKRCEAWKIIADYAPARLESLEGFDGFYDCEYYANKYYPMYQADPSCYNVELAYRRLLRGGCPATDARIQELKQKKATDCYTPPPAPGLLRQGFDAYNNGDYTQAIKHFEGFIAKTDDAAKKFKYTMLIAKIYYRDIKNYPKSRKYALQAASLNPSSGEPYLLIGKLYASSGPLCGPGTGWDSQVVTWVAIDKFKKAQSDPAVATEASKLIGQYRKYMPKKEDIFQRSIKAGTPYKVDCWIQENTRVRTAD